VYIFQLWERLAAAIKNDIYRFKSWLQATPDGPTTTKITIKHFREKIVHQKYHTNLDILNFGVIKWIEIFGTKIKI
jgi:hypothetical protein